MNTEAEVTDTNAAPVTAEAKSDVQREQPHPSLAREASVKLWTERVLSAKRKHEAAFDRMRDNMRFARGYQWPGQTKDDARYVANLTLRHVRQAVAALYAKNPKAIAQRRKTLDFVIWDGDPASLQNAMMTLQQAPQMGPQAMMDPAVQQAFALLQDVQRGQQRRKMLDKVGRTLEIVYEYQVREQIPPFKQQMKQLVRRVVTTGVGYVKLGYHRFYERRPEEVDRISDLTEQLKHLERLEADQMDGELQQDSAEAEELRQLLKAMESQDSVLVREGLDFDYPPSTSIIPDERCRQLKGFIGCRWVAQEFLLTPAQVQEIYKVDLGKAFTRYTAPGEKAGPQRGEVDTSREVESDDRAAVYEVYDKSTGLVFTVCDGYADFLAEPAPPAIRLERFWPFFQLSLNDVECDEDIFPPSDVDLIRDMQVEHNLSRQRLREHRDANRPRHVTPKGMLDEGDKAKLSRAEAHTVVELNALKQGQRVEDVLQPVPNNPIDPNLYETNSGFDDVLKVLGAQEANLGGTAGSTATESSIAEASRMSSNSSNVDDLDEFLTELAQYSSHVLLTEMDAETVREIAGPGAVWPELANEEIARDLWLVVRAGSSGRPNKSQELQNFERLAPFLLQIPGVPPQWLLEQAVERLDDRIDPADAFAAGLPSIIAQNAQARPGTGNPATDPAQQGGRGSELSPNEGDTNQGPNNPASGAPDLSGPGVPTTVNARVRQAAEGNY